QYPSLGVKLSRSSNVVSFSKTHPHLLAAGLDKVRNDPCLLVWDVTRSLDSYCNTPTGAQTPTAFNTAKTVNQQELKAAITNQWRLDAGRTTVDSYEGNEVNTNGKSKEQGPLRQYGSSEAISSCSWSIHANAPLLIAGMGNKYLRVYDIRADPASSPLQFVTKAVFNIVVDPFNSYRVASHTEDGVIKLWDIRKTSNSILTLTPETKGNLSRILFSPSQPGFLASLTKDASHIDLWDIQETCSLHQSVLPSLVNETNADYLSIPVLWKSRKTRYSTKGFASFTFIPPSAIIADQAFSSNHKPRSYCRQLPNAHTILAVHSDGKFESIKVQEACQVAWQPTGGMIMTGRKGLLSYLPVSSTDVSTRDVSRDSQPRRDEEDMHKNFTSLILNNEDQALAEQLEKDVSVIMRRRLMEGYSMDSVKNLKIIHDDRKLREVWNWVKIADQISGKLSKIGGVDYSFEGVYGICMDSNTNSNNRPSSPAAITSRSVSPKVTRHTTSVTLKNLVSSSATRLTMVDTHKPTLRYLALSACGFAFDSEGFEKVLEDLEKNGEYDKAAALALFHNNSERAIKALNSAKEEDEKGEQQYKLMSAVLASYQGGNISNNDMWRDICESLSNDMKDRPYLKAIFAYISSNNWYRVLDEREIPLRERMAIALRVLKDDAVRKTHSLFAFVFKALLTDTTCFLSVL
ncbi:WD40-repeat-containing domain protein, partial [Mycotypha africana]|uniref:WD40-repeat-containing domain protein n=1 Tax=Mycotypha africana TaxID=64632 RepID=UPI0023014F17